MFQGLKDWWERRSALREMGRTTRPQTDGFGRYFTEQIALARSALYHENAEQARTILSRLRAQFPGMARLSRGVWEILVDLGDFDEAEATIQEGFKRYPHLAHFAKGYIIVAHRRGNVQQTLRRCEAVRKRFPNMAESYSVEAACLEGLGRDDQAEATTARGLQMVADSAELLIQRARQATRRSDWPEALRRWEVVQSNVPQDVRGLLGRAKSLKELRRFDEAERLLNVGREQFYRNEWVISEWAGLAADTGNFAEAAARWKLVVGRFPMFSAAYLRGSEALRKAGRPEEEDELLSAGVKKLDSHLPVHLEYARSANRDGRWVVAVDRWRLVRERFPDCSEAREQEAKAMAAAERLSTTATPDG